MRKFICLVLFFWIPVFGSVFPVSAEAQKVYRSRDRVIDQAMDTAQRLHSPSYAQELSREVAIEEALNEMPFRPTRKPHNISAAQKNTLSRKIPVPTTTPPVKTDGIKIPVSQQLARASTISVPLDAPELSVSEPESLETKTKNKGSLQYRYLDLDNPQNRVEFGTEAYDYSYREEGFMKLDGMMYGVYMDYQHRYNENPAVDTWNEAWQAARNMNVVRVDTRLAGSRDIKYRSGGTGSHEGENHYVFETRVLGGAEIPFDRHKIILVPYAGLGYRYLLDDNGGTQTTTGAWGYNRESYYYYLPIGIDASKIYRNGWETKLNMEYDWFLGGRQYSHLEDVPGYKETLMNEQQDGYGLRGAVRLVKKGEHLDFFIEPFVRYWHIKDSKPASTSEISGIEPNNRTQEYGARLGVNF